MVRTYRVLLLLLAFSIIGCTHHIELKKITTEKVDSYKKLEQVHPYPEFLDKETGDGPYLEFVFSSSSDLKSAASKYTHHLYYNLQPCSQNKLGYDLWSGGVFEKADDLFTIYIPLNYALLERHVKGYGALDHMKYIQEAEKEGLCVIIGGGKMGFGSMRSNLLSVPIQINAADMAVSYHSQ